MIRTRFAPSPNGSLHLGHAFSAIVAHDLARERGGAFLLRIEDIDGTRSRAELAQEFRDDLAWLGLAWDEEALQSERLARYEAAAQRLMEMGLLYRCICTRAQIAAAASEHGPDGPIYPGTCKGAAAAVEAPCNWRLDVAKASALTGPLAWIDELAGPQDATPELLGDVVLVRKDEPASYHLAATLDDAADQVTLVTRGMDLFRATHIHRLLLDTSGAKLAKRRNSPSLADRRRAGEDGAALARALRAHRFPAGISLGEGLHSSP